MTKRMTTFGKILVCGVCVACLCIVGYYQSLIDQLEKKNQELTKQVKALSDFDMQEKCANKAKEVFFMFKPDPQRETFESHFAKNLNTCFVKQTTIGGGRATRMLLQDAVTQRDYASFWDFWIFGKGDPVHNVVECYVSNPAGKKETCSSQEQFDEMLKPYMEY
jgi:hypothetical protein